MPSTRERTSTRRNGCTWPANSYASATRAGATVTTPTGVGGSAKDCADGGALLPHATAMTSSAARAAAREFTQLIRGGPASKRENGEGVKKSQTACKRPSRRGARVVASPIID